MDLDLHLRVDCIRRSVVRRLVLLNVQDIQIVRFYLILFKYLALIMVVIASVVLLLIAVGVGLGGVEGLFVDSLGQIALQGVREVRLAVLAHQVPIVDQVVSHHGLCVKT